MTYKCSNTPFPDAKGKKKLCNFLAGCYWAPILNDVLPSKAPVPPLLLLARGVVRVAPVAPRLPLNRLGLHQPQLVVAKSHVRCGFNT